MPTRPASRRVLLVSDDPRWREAAASAASHVGLELHPAGSAAEAMLVLAGCHDVCRLLLGANVPETHAAALLEMTCGEAGSGVDVLLLGGAMPDMHSVPEPELLVEALAGQDSACDHGAAEAPLAAEHVRRLMDEGCVRVRFQPIVRLRDRSVIALEVLARLHRTHGAILPPNCFVPQLEQAGLGAELLRHVVREAFSVLRELDGATLALNLPLDVLRDRRTAGMLSELCRQAEFPAFRILLELTETQVVNDVAVLDHAVARLREAGYVLAIDDAGPDVPQHRAMFGLPFNWVKLDKSVVARAAASRVGRRYMADLIASAHRENLSVIAEGVEHQDTWDMAGELGADCVQGYMVARPLPAEVVPVWRAAWEAGVQQPPG